ncbi:MAG: phosphoadenosine phosphosulfate reductase, partial [Martelella sp.]
MTNSKTVAELDKTLGTVNLTGRLRLIADSGRPAVFTTSLGIEDQVITAAIAAGELDIRIVTLDTGRLFPETEA